MAELKITSPAFVHNEIIPVKYTCDGDDVNPPIDIDSIPDDAKSLVLIVDDPDAPVGNWDHWIVFNIPVTGKISEDSTPGTQGINSWGRNNWGGPCPPAGTHRYFFKVYALDIQLDLKSNADKKHVLASMEGHVLALGELIGLYART